MRTLQRPADSALIGRNQRTTRAAYSLCIGRGTRGRNWRREVDAAE